MSIPAPEVLKVFIGHDEREQKSWDVCAYTLRKHASVELQIEPISMHTLGDMYRRPWSRSDNGILFDEISNAPMSTAFAVARFFVPRLCRAGDVALFVDCDFVFTGDIAEVFDDAQPGAAVHVVKHNYRTGRSGIKMDGQYNIAYPRKNWSSFMLFDMRHQILQSTPTLEILNSATGLQLHSFSWISDEYIGSLPFEWNWLDLEPMAIHYTLGTPELGKTGHLYASLWQYELALMEANARKDQGQSS